MHDSVLSAEREWLMCVILCTYEAHTRFIIRPHRENISHGILVIFLYWITYYALPSQFTIRRNLSKYFGELGDKIYWLHKKLSGDVWCCCDGLLHSRRPLVCLSNWSMERSAAMLTKYTSLPERHHLCRICVVSLLQTLPQSLTKPNSAMDLQHTSEIRPSNVYHAKIVARILPVLSDILYTSLSSGIHSNIEF